MRNKDELIQLVKDFSDAFGPSGFEDEVAKLGRDSVSPRIQASTDAIKNTYFYPKTNTAKRPLVWLDAHADEVGFIIQALRPNGTLDFLPLGAMTTSELPTNKVKILNKDNKLVSGIISSKPPHFRTSSDENKKFEIEDLIMDVGASSLQEVKDEFGIRMAAPVVPDVSCTYDKDHDLFLGKAFDCRIGCAALIETLDRLSESKQNIDYVATLTTQEEIGGRGAEAAVDIIDADVCICFEGCPADDTFSEPYKVQTALGKGPMLRHFDCCMVTNPSFQRYALDLAEKLGIPCQESVRKGGGTNGGIIHKTRHGVPSIVIGIPVRYAHTPHCYCTLEDTLAAIELAVAIVNNLDAATIDEF